MSLNSSIRACSFFILTSVLQICCAVQYGASGITYTWKTDQWSSCFSNVTCGEGRKIRKVKCQDSSGLFVHDFNCDRSTTPTRIEPCFRVCKEHRNVLRWHVEKWSPCVPLQPQFSTSCAGTTVSGRAKRQVRCVLDTTKTVVETLACRHFWDMPETEMSCSLDCPQDCIITTRKVSCVPDGCSTDESWEQEVKEVVFTPTDGGTTCPDLSQKPACSDAYTSSQCKGSNIINDSNILKIGEWSPCQSGDSNYANILKEVQTALRPVIGTTRRNVTCISQEGLPADLRFCNVVDGAIEVQRRCVVPVDCLTSPWTEWTVKREGCITSDGKVVPEIRTRVRRLVQMPVGASAEPCPPLYEKRSISHDLPTCYKYQWLPLEWSACEVRLHGRHGNVKTVRPTCGIGIQHRNVTCVRASDNVLVEEENCHESRPPLAQRCMVPCVRDCQVSHWSRWGTCVPHENFQGTRAHKSTGYRIRERSVVVNPSNGGGDCPHLQELDLCFEETRYTWRYGDWGRCVLLDPQATCGPGNRERNRTCIRVREHDLDACGWQKDFVVSESCRVPCPDDCVESEWSQWSECSRSCFGKEEENGEQRRNKTLLAAAGKGGECVLTKKSRMRLCNLHSCWPYHWTAKEWGPCKAAQENGNGVCGAGVQQREVEWAGVAWSGGEEMKEKDIQHHLKKPDTTKSCHIPCPEDCLMTNFSDWTSCGNKCDTDAVQSRHRVVLSSPKYGGRPCPDALVEQRDCTEVLETTCLRQRKNGQPLYRWQNSNWSNCTLPGFAQRCGMGFQVRNVSCRDLTDLEVAPHHCLSQVGSDAPPSALRSCEMRCTPRCILTTWTAWTPCGYAYNSKRSRRRELVGTIEAEDDCSMVALQEEETCPILPDSLQLEGNGSDHWLSCIVEEKNRTSLMTNGQLTRHACGVGYRYRFDMQMNSETGTGPGLERDFCLVECPVDCQMTKWSDWSECDVPCGRGFRERKRRLITAANHLGRPCPDMENNTEIQREVCHIICSDYYWSASGWSQCKLPDQNATCGDGTQHRTVSCLDKWTDQEVEPFRCDPLLRPEHKLPCRLHCPGECVLSPWTVNESCSEPCSTKNYQVLKRTILRHPNSTAGPCPPLVSRQMCVLNVNCHEHSFRVGPWGSCVLPEGALCGKGDQKRPVFCVRSDGRQEDPVQCEKNHESISLKKPMSKPCYVDCPVDCVVSEWSKWNDTGCGACGTHGVMTRTRYVLQPPSDAGQPCPAELEQQTPCPFKACYHWKHSEWSSCDLQDLNGLKCGYGIRRRVVECLRFDGLTVDRAFCLTLNVTFPTGKWLDHSWLSLAQEDSQEEQTCHLPCPGDCIYSEWSAWSHCYKNCQIGQTVGHQTSTRILLFASENSSEPCNAQLYRTRPCWNDDCNFFRWRLKSSGLICEGRDGRVVQGGCAALSPPCEYWCDSLGGLCNATTGLCRCRGASRTPGRLLVDASSPPCSTGGPRPPANHSAPTPEIHLKYYPDDSKVSFWMYAMISIGTAFVIFVAVTVYLMCRSSLRQRSVSVERQPSVRRRIPVPLPFGNHSSSEGLTQNNTANNSLQNRFTDRDF